MVVAGGLGALSGVRSICRLLGGARRTETWHSALGDRPQFDFDVPVPSCRSSTLFRDPKPQRSKAESVCLRSVNFKLRNSSAPADISRTLANTTGRTAISNLTKYM